MVTFRVSAEVKDDRRVVLTLPSEVPLGPTELLVSVQTQPVDHPRQPRSSLADWADQHAEHWAARLDATDVDAFTGRRCS